ALSRARRPPVRHPSSPDLLLGLGEGAPCRPGPSPDLLLGLGCSCSPLRPRPCLSPCRHLARAERKQAASQHRGEIDSSLPRSCAERWSPRGGGPSELISARGLLP
ncbi:hypothetical protein EJB05_40504, partial [Eragrostis curvula]